MGMHKYVLAIGAILLLLWLAADINSTTSSNSSIYLNSAIAGGEYLLHHTQNDGSFNYEYDPIANTLKDDYNILRHAGTTYSLLELFEATRDEKFLRNATNNLEYIVRQIKPCPLAITGSCITKDEEVKLGGNALAILAFAKYQSITNDDRYLSTAQELANFIVNTQNSSGQFEIHKIDGDEISEFVSGYYPGEAIFALSQLYEVDPSPQWMRAAHNGALWLITVRDKKVETADLNHDHWLLYGLAEIYQNKADPIYEEHAWRITSAIINSQHRNLEGAQSLWNGGFYNPPRSTPTATRVEGLLAAYQLLKDANKTEEATQALEAARLAADFCIKTQMTDPKASVLGVSSDAVGGFHEDLNSYTIRIDYVQHNISALLKLHQILSREKMI